MLLKTKKLCWSDVHIFVTYFAYFIKIMIGVIRNKKKFNEGLKVYIYKS